eukprot:s952_g9.t1
MPEKNKCRGPINSIPDPITRPGCEDDGAGRAAPVAFCEGIVLPVAKYCFGKAPTRCRLQNRRREAAGLAHALNITGAIVCLYVRLSVGVGKRPRPTVSFRACAQTDYTCSLDAPSAAVKHWKRLI